MILIVGIFASLGAMPVVIFNTELAAPGKIQFVGDVIDAYTDFKLSGVKVSTDKASTTTNAKGHFVLSVPADKQKKFYKISFSKKGYEDDYLDSIAADRKEPILIGLMKPFR